MRNAVAGLALLIMASPWLTPAARGQDSARGPDAKEAKLIGVLKSGAPVKEKADACRELARIGTKQSVAPLAALLDDEKLAHMARYALEPLRDPSVDEALRGALPRLKGREAVGVIGSIGVRRDAKAFELLKARLTDGDADVVQAAARALGSLGSSAAARALEDSLPAAQPANQPAFYEGLFRCAERFTASGGATDAIAILDRLSAPQVPEAVREGAVRKARILRAQPGRKI
jgi:hypothetical protein